MKLPGAARRILFLMLLVPIGMQAATIPPRGGTDPRVRIVAYNPDDVVRLQGFVGYQIHIEWAPGEEFVNLGAGDVGGFDIGAERNHFFIKPKQERVATNVTVLTTRRAYHFDYRVQRAPRDPDRAADLVYSIRFTYPDDEAREASEAGRQRLIDERLRADPGRPRQTDYWYCGAPSLRPVTAYDDGVQTRLKFGARAEFPAIFVRNDDASESLLNFTVERDEVVIHRVARQFILRRGQFVGCIVNRSFNGGGERLPTGTTVPGVHRQTRELAP